MRNQHQRVVVCRAKGIPHNVGLIVEDEPDLLTITLEEDLISVQGAELLESALNENVQHWQRLSENREGPPPRIWAS